MRLNLKKLFQLKDTKSIIFYLVIIIIIYIFIMILEPKTGWAICDNGIGGNCWKMSDSEFIFRLIVQSIIPSILTLLTIFIVIFFIIKKKSILNLVILILFIVLPTIPIHIPNPDCMFESWLCSGHTELKPIMQFMNNEIRTSFMIIDHFNFDSKNYLYYNIINGAIIYEYIFLMIFFLFLLSILVEKILILVRFNKISIF